jgi:hypothetical protein
MRNKVGVTDKMVRQMFSKRIEKIIATKVAAIEENASFLKGSALHLDAYLQIMHIVESDNEGLKTHVIALLNKSCAENLKRL